MILKINARGDVEFLRADNAKEVARNIDLTIEMEKIKMENAVLNIRLKEREAKSEDTTCTKCKIKLDHTERCTKNDINMVESRKRRRLQENSPPFNRTEDDNLGIEVDHSYATEEEIISGI